MSIGCLLVCVASASSCKHEKPSPATSVSAAALAGENTAGHEVRYTEELNRAHLRWQQQPKLPKCAEFLNSEPSDAELCHAAEMTLAAVEALPATATPEQALPVLGDAALALVRLFERARYLSLEEVGKERLAGVDAGVNGHASSSSSVSAAASSAPRARLTRPPEHRSLKLAEGPISFLLQNTARLERDVLRHFSAYLEYAPLPVRRLALARAKQLYAEHPRWPALIRVLREASMLETDTELKAQLHELTFASPKSAQDAGSK